MEQKDIKLLLKDLCARLPYGVKITWTEKVWVTATPNMYSFICEKQEFTWKPYLRPLLSMTDEEREEYRKFSYYGAAGVRPYTHGDFVAVPSFEKMDWLNAHHFDYRGLIEKGLALEAPEDMYKNK